MHPQASVYWGPAIVCPGNRTLPAVSRQNSLKDASFVGVIVPELSESILVLPVRKSGIE